MIHNLCRSLLEYNAIAIYTRATASLFYYATFTGCMFAFYSLVSIVMQRSSALMFNLQILTSDFYSILAGVYLFHIGFQPLYALSFVLVISGTVLYSLRTTNQKSKRETGWMRARVGCCLWVPLCWGKTGCPGLLGITRWVLLILLIK